MTTTGHPYVEATPTGTPKPSATRANALVVTAAAIGAATTWAVSRAAIGDPLIVAFQGGEQQSITIASAIIAALVAGALGWALLAVLSRITVKARTLWTGIATVVLMLSMVGPTSAETTTATMSALVLMHVVVGLILISGLRRNALH